jgi:hypothetical protein
VVEVEAEAVEPGLLLLNEVAVEEEARVVQQYQ